MQSLQKLELQAKFLQDIAAQYLPPTKRALRKVFLTIFTYENQGESMTNIINSLNLDAACPATYQKHLTEIYKLFAQVPDSGVEQGAIGRGQSGKLFHWLWHERFPRWLSERPHPLDDLDSAWKRLLTRASYSEDIGPVEMLPGMSPRDLGVVEEKVWPLGSKVRLQLPRIGQEGQTHLLFLDRGISGSVYCLCPSLYAPDTCVPTGVLGEMLLLPQSASGRQSFTLTGKPGQEQLFALFTPEPLPLAWLPRAGQKPLVLSREQLLELIETVDRASNYTALYTDFLVSAPSVY